MILKRPKGSLATLDDFAISAIKETANITGGAFLSALSDTVGISFIQSVPSHSIGTMKEIVDTAIAKLDHEKGSKPAVAFEIDFALSVTTTTDAVTTHYIFLLDVAFAQKLLEALGSKA